MRDDAKRPRFGPGPLDVSGFPAPLPDGRRFRGCLSDAMDDTAEDAPAAPRTTSPLTGWDLRKRALELQTQAARLPTARASGRIRDAVSNNAVVVLRASGEERGGGAAQRLLRLLHHAIEHRPLFEHHAILEPAFERRQLVERGQRRQARAATDPVTARV